MMNGDVQINNLMKNECISMHLKEGQIMFVMEALMVLDGLERVAGHCWGSRRGLEAVHYGMCLQNAYYINCWISFGDAYGSVLECAQWITAEETDSSGVCVRLEDSCLRPACCTRSRL